ncbi:hypothetical protein T492DRAFT_540220 [Pavlovales sp. CCMP2436]|nr:hypothetical protein T492DRAFT_540220 [Pavlovales sp. CCMP2436]
MFASRRGRGVVRRGAAVIGGPRCAERSARESLRPDAGSLTILRIIAPNLAESCCASCMSEHTLRLVDHPSCRARPCLSFLPSMSRRLLLQAVPSRHVLASARGAEAGAHSSVKAISTGAWSGSGGATVGSRCATGSRLARRSRAASCVACLVPPFDFDPFELCPTRLFLRDMPERWRRSSGGRKGACTHKSEFCARRGSSAHANAR